MNVSKTLRVGLAALVVALGGSAALAVPVTFQMQGTITEVDDISNLTGVQVGDTWTLDYTFDSEAPDSAPGDPAYGIYDIDTMSLVIGGTSFNPVTPMGLSLWDDTSDEYLVGGIPSIAGAADPEFFVDLVDDDGTVFSDDSLPLAPLDLAEFELGEFALFATGEGPSVDIFGTVDSFTPEPGTLSLLAFGALLAARRRRQAG